MKCILTTTLLCLLAFTGAFAQTITPGKIIDSVSTQVPGQTYALYLPESYTESEKYPVIFFFEPMARGTLPLHLYQELSEKYEIILVCSNNAKNYTENSKSLEAAEAMVNDVSLRFSIDEDLVITSGFSGGSRVAVSVAILTDFVKGVIGVGAVRSILLPDETRGPFDKPYAGIVGNRDFNFLEHYDAENSFRSEGIRTIRLTGAHPHQWANPEDFEMAFLWITAVLKEKSYKGWLTEEMINDYLTNLRDSVSILDADRVQGYFESVGVSIQDFSVDESQLKKDRKKLKSALAMERRLRRQFQDSIASALQLAQDKRANTSLRWISAAVSSIKNQKEKSQIKALMKERTVRMVSAIGYESMITSMNRGDYEAAFAALEIWNSVVENEQWTNWFNCKIYALKGDLIESRKYLIRLMESGYTNWNSLAVDPAFDALRNTEQYKTLALPGG